MDPGSLVLHRLSVALQTRGIQTIIPVAELHHTADSVTN